MILSRDSSGASLTPRGSVVAIGAFDGVHIGHRALLSQLRARADALGLPAVVVTFEPLPRQHFARAPLLRLTPFRERAERIRDAGIDHLVCLRFDRDLAQTSAEDFIEQVLVRRVHAREVWVGPGFRFGHGRAGDLEVLQASGLQHGFTAREIAALTADGERVSSSRIREMLLASAFAAAEHALGRRYSYAGRRTRWDSAAFLRCVSMAPA